MSQDLSANMQFCNTAQCFLLTHTSDHSQTHVIWIPAVNPFDLPSVASKAPAYSQEMLINESSTRLHTIILLLCYTCTWMCLLWRILRFIQETNRTVLPINNWLLNSQSQWAYDWALRYIIFNVAGYNLHMRLANKY